jgi:gluconate 2-dehydrogenase gamma chain
VFNDQDQFSRRTFIHHLTFFGGGAVLLGSACSRTVDTEANAPAPPSPRRTQPFISSHRTFTNEEFAVVSAACERILPHDEDPGAMDAHVPQYIDAMLQTPDLAEMREEFIAGTAALNRRSQKMVHKNFAEASPEEQDRLLELFKDSPVGTGEAHYYELLTVLTLEGFLGDPSYGGNKDRVGWTLVGFGTSEPPPGYDGNHHLHSHGRR